MMYSVLEMRLAFAHFFEEYLKLKNETPFLVRPYPMQEEQKKVIQKEMDRLEHLGII